MRSHGGQTFSTRTDAQGHYRVSGHQASIYITRVYPLAGSGYLSVSKTQQGWPAGAKSLVVDFKLTRGKILRGRVIDADTGRPVAGCGLVYQPRRGNPHNRNEYDLRNPVRTDAKGEFQVTALPGEGFVAVEAPDPDTIRVTLPKTNRGTAFPHGFADVKLAEEGDPGPVEVRLRKGVTLEARAVDPDGQTVQGRCRASQEHPRQADRQVGTGRILRGRRPSASGVPIPTSRIASSSSTRGASSGPSLS